MKYFEFEHLPEKLNLPEKLKPISRSICGVAQYMEENLPPGAEKSAGLRKLLEAKDCFVRTLV